MMQATSGRRRYVQSVAASCLVATLLAALIGPGARAAVAGSMDYQGYLTDPSGAAIDADASITFSIYTVEIGGTALWTETMLVPVDSGLFSVTLGNPANPFPPGLFDTPLFLGIDIGGDGEMVPRRALTTTAFSFKADDATTLQGNTAADLDQSSAVEALQANTVLQFDSVLTLGAGGEARIEAPGGLEAANAASGPDLIVGGIGSGADFDDGIIASPVTLSSSDLILQTNDALQIRLDADGNGEDADFLITDKDNRIIFNVDEDGQVRLHGATSLTAGDDPTFGPVLSFIGETTDQTEAGRIRFFESTAPANNLRGGYLHYDASANKMHIGVHDANDTNLANDENILTIERASGQVGIGTASPTRELTVNDTDGSSDAVINVTAPNRELLLGVNQSSGGIIAMQTANDLQLRTSGTTRVVVDAAGDVEVRNDLLVEGELGKDLGSGQFIPAAPYGFGRVVMDGPNIDFIRKTPNITSIEWNAAFYEIRFVENCSPNGSFSPDAFLLLTANILHNRTARTFVLCDNGKVTGRVFFDDGIFVALQSDFDFVVYRYEMP